MQHKKQIIHDKLKCSKCGYWLPLDEFGNNKATSTGKQSYCKSCRKGSYDSKRKKHISNTGVIGLFRNECPVCNNFFTTKNAIKTFCSDKCRKKDWYQNNEQTKSAKKFGTSLNVYNIKRMDK